MPARRAFLDTFTFRLLLALVGLVGLIVVLLVATRHRGSAAVAWARGGAVALAVSGLFGLLVVLGRGA